MALTSDELRRFARGTDSTGSGSTNVRFHSITHKGPVARMKKGTQRFYATNVPSADIIAYLTTFRSKSSVRFAINGGGE